MKEIRLDIAGVPITVAYDDCTNGQNLFRHESGAILEFSSEMVKVYKLSWNNKHEIIALTTKKDNETIIELAWQCFFKALAIHNPEEVSSYDVLSKDMYACSFCKCWSQIAEELANTEYAYDSEEDFMDAQDEDWDSYNDIEWRS